MTSVVVYKNLPRSLLASLQSEFDVTYFEKIDGSNHARFADAIKGADGLLGASVRLSADMLDQAPRLRIISSISVGLDQFDLAYLDSRGIMLAHTPDVLTETTADAIFALLLASARRIVELAEFVKKGRWMESIGEMHYGVNVHGKTIGLVGMGRIGRAVARRAHLGFGMKVLYHSRSAAPDAESTFGATAVSLDTLLAQADFVCLVLPLTRATERLMGEREFALMRPDAIFINGARGRIVDEAALIAALRAGRIRAAGLDVFEREPLPTDSPLLKMANVVALPHLGSATAETRLAMATVAVENLRAGLRGETPLYQANSPDFKKGAIS
jgi:phosphogluconate 2-dehydrogenase/gluconate 2-dehydrogenase